MVAPYEVPSPTHSTLGKIGGRQMDHGHVISAYYAISYAIKIHVSPYVSTNAYNVQEFCCHG